MHEILNSKYSNWNDLWKDLMIKHRSCDTLPDCWEKKENAFHYWKTAQECEQQFINEIISGMEIRPSSNVLDIGAGPGTLAIPISKKVAHVTAVEPAKGMRQMLSENILKANISNINILDKPWEAIDISKNLSPSYDVVVAAFSLDMVDIAKAIEKMIDACSGHLYLYWFAGNPSWECRFKNLFSSVFDKVYSPKPMGWILFNILYQMGIYPEVSFFPYEKINRFSSPDDAVMHFVSRYHITSDLQKEELKKHLENYLEEGSEQWLLRCSATCMRFHWKREDM